MHHKIVFKLLAALVLFLFLFSGIAEAETFTVTKTADTADGVCDPTDCSLREAVIAANKDTKTAPHTIVVPTGTYTLTLAGRDENLSATGDLDIRNSLTLQGTGAATTIIEACDSAAGPCTGIDRVLDIVGQISVTITDITIRNGSLSGAAQSGSGISNDTATLILNRVVVKENTTPQDGGGIDNLNGNVTLLDTTVSGNSAGHSGGGIFNRAGGALSIFKSTISGNRASNTGGGIANEGSASLVNMTISGNTATSASGGGIDTATGPISLNQVTIYLNRAATDGGGLSVRSGSVNLRSTILAGNTSASTPSKDCSGSITSLGHNLIGVNSGCIAPAAGDQAGAVASPIDPMLGVLAENGGPTQTHALLIGSPAIDAVEIIDCQVTEDQRGTRRPVDGNDDGHVACDVGAYETSSKISVSPIFYDFASAVSGESPPAKSFIVSNVGTANLVIGAVTLRGTNSLEFKTQNDACSGQTLAPAGACAIEIVFLPGSSGPKEATLVVPSNDPLTPTLFVLLNGAGTSVPVPRLLVNGAAPAPDLQISFGNVLLGTFLDQLVVIGNGGTLNLVLGNIAQNTPLSAPFSVVTDDCSGKAVASFATCNLTIRFAPTVGGNYKETFDVPSNDPNSPNITLSVNGDGVGVSGSNRFPSAPELISPSDGQTGLGTTVTFHWRSSIDADGDPLIYHINYCSNSDFTSCSPVDVPSPSNKSDTGAIVLSGSGLAVVGMVLNAFGRKKTKAVAVLLIIGATLVACGGKGGQSGSPAPTEISFTASGLSAGATYTWKVIADDGKGGQTESAVRTFTTQ